MTRPRPARQQTMCARFTTLLVATITIVVGGGAGLATAAAQLPATATAVGVRTARPPHLTKLHAGWRETPCLDCHKAATLTKTHTQDVGTPATCGRCHGYNGAPHEAHAIVTNPCGNCHATVEHAKRFQAPGECIGCHYHPSSPNGR